MTFLCLSYYDSEKKSVVSTTKGGFMKEYLQQLKETELFYGICEGELEEMLSCLSATTIPYPKDACIYQRGTRITKVALLLKGSIHIQKEDYWGNLSILQKISEGEVFGEVYACLSNEEMLYNAVAVTDCVVLFLDVNRIFHVCPSACQFHSRLVRNLLSVMAAKNKALTQKLAHMSKRNTREKLLSYLSEQSLKAGSSVFDIPFNRQQLSSFLSVDRSAMSNELCKMRDEGILEFNRNHFILKEDGCPHRNNQRL